MYRSAVRLTMGGAAGLTCLATAGGLWLRTTSAAAASSGLSSEEFREFELIKVKPYNHNSKLYTVKVPGLSGMPVASYVVTKGPLGSDGKPTMRPYTPINTKANDVLELLVKTYPTGALTPYLDKLKPGAKLEIKGPMPKIQYKANMKKEIGMLAGGTGITPMLQVMQKIADDPNDKTKVTLVFSNSTEDDILLKEQLDQLAAKNKNFSITYVVSKPKGDWSGERGRITSQLIKKKMPAPGPDSLVMVCGPPGFMGAISGPKAKDYSQGELSGYLNSLGYKPDQVFKF
jgi:cytochrome-b5 reductase